MTSRYAPRDMPQVRLCLANQPDGRKVKAGPETGVTEQTVGELRARTTWPPGLVLVVPSGDRSGLTVEVVKSEL
jgi:hypothetical protein